MKPILPQQTDVTSGDEIRQAILHLASIEAKLVSLAKRDPSKIDEGHRAKEFVISVYSCFFQKEYVCFVHLFVSVVDISL